MNWIKYSFALLAGVLAMSACQRELDPDGQSVVPEARTTRLTITSEDPGTKTAMNYSEEDGKYIPSWKKGDAIGVFIDDFAASATAASGTLTNGSEDGEAASFSGEVPELTDDDHTAYAFYPARAFYGTESGKVVDLEIPEIQFPTSTSFDPKADLLVGVPKTFTVSDGVPAAVNGAQFRRVCAILKVTLVDNTGGSLSSETVKSVRLDFASGQNVTGAFRYDFTNQKACDVQLVAASAKNHVTADYSASPIAFGSNFFLLVSPGTYTGALTVTIQTNKHEVVKTVANIGTWELNSGKVSPIKVNLGSSTSVERVYFQDNFDWLFKYWDDLQTAKTPNNLFKTSYLRLKTQVTDGVGANMSTHAQPSIWKHNSSTVGAQLKLFGYEDLNEDGQLLYVEENYLKLCASDRQTALKLPSISFGDSPVNVRLSFDWCRHMSNSDNLDAVPLVVQVLNQGTCADSGNAVSNVFTTSQTKGKLFWTHASVILNGVTNSTRVVFKENYDTFTQTGNHRFHLDNIKITGADASPAPFPVVWSFSNPGDTWQDNEDYNCISYSGSWVFSDEHKGKLTLYRPGDNRSTTSPPTYAYYENATSTEVIAGGRLYSQGVYENDYWLFEIYNVQNPAGTYTISYKTCSTNAGPRVFLLEYSTDDGVTWTSINPKTKALKKNDGTEYDGGKKYTYTYTTSSAPSFANNELRTVNESFHIDAIDSPITLKIRAKVVSKMKNDGTGNMSSNHHGGAHRLGGSASITFMPY